MPPPDEESKHKKPRESNDDDSLRCLWMPASDAPKSPSNKAGQASGHLMEDHFGQGAMEPESDDDDKIRRGKAYLQFQEERASRLTAGKHATKTTAQPKEGHDCVGFSQANSRVFGGEKPAAQSKAQTARCPENSGPSSALFWRPWQTCWPWQDMGGWS